jgi:hypothetical protein
VLTAARALGALALGLALAWPCAARAESPKLQAARAAYWSLDYAQSQILADEVLATSGLVHADLVEATRLEALSLAALGKTDASRESFVSLLECDATFELDPKLGPRFRVPYLEARDYWRGQVTRASLEVVYRAEERSLRATLKDPRGKIRRVVVAYRTAMEAPFVSAERATTGDASVEVAAAADRLDYYAQALNALDQVVLEVGSPQQPLSFVAPPRAILRPDTTAPVSAAPATATRGSSLTSSPWFWVGAGAAAAGLAVGGYFAFRGHGDANPTIVARPDLRCGAQSVSCF